MDRGTTRGVSLRADAERNRARIIHAARTLYARHGLGASMAAIAREAGVGKATLARHFATPHELIVAVFADRMHSYVDATEAALGDLDPWQGFVGYVTAVCEMQAQDRGVADLLTLTFQEHTQLEVLRQRAYDGCARIIDRAKATGMLHEDVHPRDIALLMMANAGVVSSTALDAPDSWRRLVGHMLRGYATPGAPTPPIPPAPTTDALNTAMRRGPHLG